MSQRHQNRLRQLNRSVPGTRSAALLLVVFLSLQFSRVYFIMPSGAAECPTVDMAECPLMHTGECPMHHMDETTWPHHAGQEVVVAQLPASGDGGCSLRCCKGDSDGVGIIPLELFGTPTMVSYQRPETGWSVLPKQVDSVIENDLPLPFRPPRHLS